MEPQRQWSLQPVSLWWCWGELREQMEVNIYRAREGDGEGLPALFTVPFMCTFP